MERQILFHRTKPMGTDIADAIEAIIGRDQQGLPASITKEAVATELVRIANTDDDGEVVTLSAMSEKLAKDNFASLLENTTIFQSGYEHYHERTQNPVVPVTVYFFNYVYDDGARDCLDAMTDNEVKQALPKRPSLQRDAANQIIEENGKPVGHSGKVAGIVVFPRGSQAKLLTAWVTRMTSLAIGHNEATLQLLEEVSPNAKLTHERLRESNTEFAQQSKTLLASRRKR